MTLSELFEQLQVFRVASVHDIAGNEIRTKHFVISTDRKGNFTCTERMASPNWIISYVVSKESQSNIKK